MSFFVSRLMQAAPAIRGMLSLELQIGLDFSQSNLPTLIVVIFCLIEAGVIAAPDIHRYLADRRCRFDRESIDLLLDTYDGDDPRRHLWERDLEGDYSVVRPVIADELPWLASD